MCILFVSVPMSNNQNQQNTSVVENQKLSTQVSKLYFTESDVLSFYIVFILKKSSKLFQIYVPKL